MRNKKIFHLSIYLFILFANIFCLEDGDDTQDDWLHVENAKIVDKNGKEVWLTGVNWFGFNTGSGVFDGVWAVNLKSALKDIADHGFNLLRVPVSVEILLQWKNGLPDPKVPQINGFINEELVEEDGTVMSSFKVWGQTLKWCKENGMKVMVDIHSAESHASGHIFPLWYHGSFTTEDWLEALEWVADYYKNDDTIIAIDLKNEPHGKYDDDEFAKWDGSTDANNWKYAAELGASKVLSKNPNLLVMIEGIEVYPKEGFDWNSPSKDWGTEEENYYGGWWGGNFYGVRDFPIDLGKYQSQLVYSPHDYGPLVYAQSWFHEGFDSDSLMEECWHDHWFFILEEKIAPLLIGEWGGFMDGGPNQKWMELLRDLMIKNHIHHTFWCFNENSGDTGGLVKGNFKEWDEEKYALIKPSLWQSGGKFVGLDHKIPLGANGISLGDL
ncbi:MAG: glycoside hydrolase family 5 protein [Clostridia bacterium]|nr:glycoside hydrolase family 5 protein [Clostridia bacterium]